MCLLWSTKCVFISQKTTVYIVIAVKSSNITTFILFLWRGLHQVFLALKVGSSFKLVPVEQQGQTYRRVLLRTSVVCTDTSKLKNVDKLYWCLSTKFWYRYTTSWGNHQGCKFLAGSTPHTLFWSRQRKQSGTRVSACMMRTECWNPCYIIGVTCILYYVSKHGCIDVNKCYYKHNKTQRQNTILTTREQYMSKLSPMNYQISFGYLFLLNIVRFEVFATVTM
jgi:hypothetical protein